MFNIQKEFKNGNMMIKQVCKFCGHSRARLNKRFEIYCLSCKQQLKTEEEKKK